MAKSKLRKNRYQPSETKAASNVVELDSSLIRLKTSSGRVAEIEPPDVLENISQEQMERHNIHTGNETFDEIPEGTLVTPARSKRSA